MPLYRLFKLVSQDEKGVGFTIQKATFRILGLFWEPGGLSRRLYTAIPIFFILLAKVVTGLKVFKYRILTLNDFTDMVLTLIVALVFASSTLKLYLLHRSKKEIKELIDFLESMPRLQNHKTLQKMEGVCMWYMQILLLSTVPQYSLSLSKGELPFKSAWPFDTNTTAGWWTAYCTDIVSAFFAMMIQISFDTLLVMSVAVMTAHLARLRRILSNIGMNPSADDAIIKLAIKLHVDLLHGADLINNAYRVLVMFQSLYAIVHAVVIIFYLVKAPDISNSVAMSFMLVAAYSQLLIYCSSGQRLTTEFEKIHGAVFDNRWYRSKPRVRRAIVVMGLRSQRPVIVSNYGIFTALHTTFLHSCQESFSYFIVFRTLAANINLY